MADVAIWAAATANVPRDYLIPGAQELLPKSVSAAMDGSAAAVAASFRYPIDAVKSNSACETRASSLQVVV